MWINHKMIYLKEAIKNIILVSSLITLILFLSLYNSNLKFGYRSMLLIEDFFFVCLFCFLKIPSILGFPGGASDKEPTCQCRRLKRLGFDPLLGRSPGGGHGNPLQCSCLEKPKDRGPWWAKVHGSHAQLSD